MQAKQIKIFDTTLRDGQQCPGAGMSFEENIAYAKLAAKVGVDVIEAGFPAASQSEFDIVHTIAQELSGLSAGPIVAALCQLREPQVDATIKALEPLVKHQRARLHTYLPVDPELMRVSLGKAADQHSVLIEDVYRFAKKASDAGLEVEFSPEGYSRMGENFNFVTDVLRAAVEGGVTIMNCPDTIGGACKLQGKEYFVEKMKLHADILKKEFPAKNIIWSAHCHNDFGLALENTMNAVFWGPVTQIEGCFNGIGERAGNVSLEQCIMYLKCFGAIGNGETSFFTNINTEHLKSISDFVSQHMLLRQPHWPITGGNSAKHSSGGHTNAIMKNPLAYQPFDPKEIGNEISFLFGPSSGGNHLKTIIEGFGYTCDDTEKTNIAQFIKDHYADRRKGVTDDELFNAYLYYRKPIKSNSFEYSKIEDENRLKIMGDFFDQEKVFIISWKGNNSVLSALHDKIKEYVKDISIENYHSQSLGSGIDAASKSTIVLKISDNDLFTGIGEDKDIEVSALKALIDAVNKAYIEQNYKKVN